MSRTDDTIAIATERPDPLAQRTIPYQPALDGLRALAVGLVLVFHGGFGWLSGGYVGVSVFFTLSGYLITSLLLVEHQRTGTLHLGSFYARRLKRLLPASLLCLGVVSLAAAGGAFDEFDNLRRDLLGALFQVANWVKLVDGASYADLTNATLGRVSPLEHYWSLAIEEQFYWLWPLVLAGVFRWSRSSRTVTRSIVAITALGAAAAPLIAWRWGADAAYWATPARVGEILIGATLAAIVQVRGVWGRWSRWLAPVGLAVVLWAGLTWPAGSGPAYEGWLPAFALASAAVIAGLQHPSAVRTALSWRPIVWTGTISYGLYLFHWPIFAVLTSDRVGTDGWGLFVLRIVVTFAVAAASSSLLEQPIRTWNPHWHRSFAAAGLATAVLVAVVVVAVHPTPSFSADANAGGVATIVPLDGPLVSLDVVDATGSDTAPPASATPESTAPEITSPPSMAPATTAPGTTAPGTTAPGTTAPGTTAAASTAPASTAPPPPVPVPAVTRPVRILSVGDSTAQATAIGLTAWAVDHPDMAQVTDASVPGCGFIREGVSPIASAFDLKGPCDDLLEWRVPDLVQELRPDVVMLMVTLRDVEDRIWNEAEGAIGPFDPRFRERLAADYRRLAAELAALGVTKVAWVLPPHPIARFYGDQIMMRDLDRYRVQFEVIREIAAADPDRISVVDMQAWIEATGRFRDESLRPDGLHWTPEAARFVTDQFLAGSVIAAAVS